MDTMKKFFLAGLGLTQEVVEWVKKEFDDLAEKGEKADGKRFNSAKDLYKRVEKNIEELKGFVNPFKEKNDTERDKKMEELIQDIESLKKEIEMLKQTKDK